MNHTLSSKVLEPLKNIIYMARRFKLATMFNLLGLIAAFGLFFLLMAQIFYQATYNRGLESRERLYRIESDFMSNNHLLDRSIFYPIVDVLDSLSEVESYSLMYKISDDPVYASFFKQKFITQNGDTLSFSWNPYCSEKAISTLRSQALSGEIEWRSDDPDRDRRGVIIPKSVAMKYFGTIDAAGRKMMPIFKDGTSNTWSVRGVYEDFPENSDLSNCIYEVMRDNQKEAYQYSLAPNFGCIVKLKHVPDDVDALNNRLKRLLLSTMEHHGWEHYADMAEMSIPVVKSLINDMRIKLTPMKNSYFETSPSVSSGKNGYKTMFVIMILASLLLIIIASIHFLNFALVESPTRVRGINIRKALGANRHTLLMGIIAECVITSVLACLVALLLCAALFYKSIAYLLIDGRLSMWFYCGIAFFTLIVAVAVGIAAGFYPARFVTSFVPAMALKGNFGLTPQGHKLRKVLIGFQLFISFLLVIYLGILLLEQHYIHSPIYSFDKERVYLSNVPISTTDSTRQVLHAELTALDGVREVSFSDGSMALSDVHPGQLVEDRGHILSFDYNTVDSAYLRTMGIEIIEGRPFKHNEDSVVIINKTALQQWDWIKVGSKIPSLYSNQDSLTIVGVCDDIRYNTTRLHSHQPFALIIEASGGNRNTLNMRIDGGNHKRTLADANYILLKHFKQDAKLLVSFDDKLEETYDNEFRFFKWIEILSFVCMLITLIGLFCLTMFETEYRRKEIGIRKVVGAKTGEIILMLCLQYIPLILISYAAAVPIALFSGQQTLKHFNEHTEIHWWVFPLALVIVGGIMMTTILLRSWRTARENPVKSIKSE